VSRVSDTDKRIAAQREHANAHTAAAAPLAGSGFATSAPPAGDIAITCYEGTVPAFVDAELDRLYGNIHCSLAHLKYYDGLNAITHTYVARKQQEVIAIFLFRRDRHEVRVLNEGMRVDDAEITRFTNYIFSTWSSVSLISFHAVQNETQTLLYPHQRHVCTTEIVLPLPNSAEAYLAGLGKNMRRNIRRYMDKLKRSYPSFRYEVFEKEAINEQHVRDIINLNRTRISGKNKAYGIHDEVDRIVALTKECGLVGVATIDGEVCGGAVGYLVGKNFFFKIIAHDPKYNAFSTGILCCYLTICECIARGCHDYNFMWNEYEYKFALGAIPRNLEHLSIYRSRLQMLLNARTVLSVAAHGYRYQASSLLEKTGREEQLSPAQRRMFRLLDGARRLKHAVSGVRKRLSDRQHD
jgi:hypothetical protein